jgi:hypothetical protein
MNRVNSNIDGVLKAVLESALLAERAGLGEVCDLVIKGG